MKNRNHIDAKVLAQAAKWAKPKLRKKYTFAPKQMTVGKYVKDSKDPKLQRKYAKYMKKETSKKKAINATDSDKVHSKWQSMNNFANLRSQNMEFAQGKNKARKSKKLAKLDSLAWESVAIPQDDKIFGNECGVGELEVIDSKAFFANYNVNDLNIEEYALDSNTNNTAHRNKVYDDTKGLKDTLDIDKFIHESKELLKLIQYSVHKRHPIKSKRRKTLKEKSDEWKTLRALEKQFDETMLFTQQCHIKEELLKLLRINASEFERDAKCKMKEKWQKHRTTKLEYMERNAKDGNDKEPPMKKRKLHGKKGEFRKQIENLHEKQNIEQITKTWDALLANSKDKMIVMGFYASYDSEMEQLCNEYRNYIEFVKVDHVDLNGDIARGHNIKVLPTLVFMDINKKEIGRIDGEHGIEVIKQTMDGLLGVTNDRTRRLHRLLLKGIADLGFNDATKIQKEVIPMAIDGTKDVLIAAATGSGKTLSFGIPIINDLLYNNELESGSNADLYGLIITPTRELAIQIQSHLSCLIKYSTLQCVCVVGGMSLAKQRRLVKSSPEIVIATPGRIWQLMQHNESLHLRDLTELRYLVLDEADRLLSSNHYIELKHILNIIKTVWSANESKQQFAVDLEQFLESDGEIRDDRRQTFIVSATLTLESVNRQKKTESKAPIFANLAMLVPFQNSISIVDQTPRHRTTHSVMEYEIPLDVSDKDAMISYLLQIYKGRTLLFSNTIGSVKRITLILKELAFNAYCIHSQQQQRQRLKNLDRFVNTAQCVLICTDICARGLDIPSVDNVIHFQCALSAEDYIHRTGRIGRHETDETKCNEIEKDGNSFLLISAQEHKLYNKIIVALKRPEGLCKLSIRERLLVQIRRQVSIAKKIAAVLDNTRRMHRKTSSLQRMADAAGIELDEINCRALNIMKTNDNQRNDKSNRKKKLSRRNKHRSFEYGVISQQNQQSVHKEIKSLRQQLKQLKAQNDLRRPKSSYLTKTFL